MDKQPYSSQGLAFHGGNRMSNPNNGRNSTIEKQKDVTKNLLSAQIEDNLSRLFECLKLEYGKYVFIFIKNLKLKLLWSNKLIKLGGLEF